MHSTNPRGLNVDLPSLGKLSPDPQHRCIVLQRNQQTLIIGPPSLVQNIDGTSERFRTLRPSFLNPINLRQVRENQPRLRVRGSQTLLQNGSRSQEQLLRFWVLLAPKSQSRGVIQIQPDTRMTGWKAFFVDLTSPLNQALRFIVTIARLQQRGQVSQSGRNTRMFRTKHFLPGRNRLPQQ